MADRDDEMIEKISAIAGWLSECDLEDYLPVLLENGYNSLAKCIRIDANSLSQMGITNAEHVEKLFGAVNDLKGRGIRGSPSPGSLDPDQMVKDFIDDMEVEKQKQAATVPSIEASDTNTGEEAKVRRRGGTLARQEALKRITMTVMSSKKCIQCLWWQSGFHLH
ncbi:uncharacterized protein LOC134197915 [Corticium candelabrum]|uniref:uncharacterized protein LOC134197915 n=1 Tax=Corticium candelabrum TaxID=121492 RepID=UPI002E277185|nr:uncharacterized protein LOC134197915 [Corticium candelabrum]